MQTNIIFILIIIINKFKLIKMRLFKSLYRFCTTINTTSLTRYTHFTQIQAKELVRRPNQLRNVLLQHIDNFGQLPIERYWKMALTDPQFGYYGKKNVFAKEGDFTTSPEISPLFGEMIGVWITYFLKRTNIFDEQSQKITKRFRIVQLGGGRGLLIKDIIRALSDFKIQNNFQINFIQVSQYNRKAQQDSVFEQFKKKDHYFKFQHQKSTNKHEYFTSQNLDKDVQLMWFQTIEQLYHRDVEKQKRREEIPFTIFVMNEFMDALPITVLKYTESGWKEKVLTKSNKNEMHFQLKLSSRELPQKMIPTTQSAVVGQEIQISHLSLLTMDLLAKIIQKHGGAIINIDYGDQGAFVDSVRAIKDHKYIPAPYFWQIPGECDLSAYVNFGALAQFAEKNTGIKAYEAIPQGYFLQAMGIVPRVDILKKTMNEQQQKRIESEYERLVLPSEMGQIYKVQIITKKQYGQIYPYIETNQNSF